MAAFMLASIMVESQNSLSDSIFLCVISFTLGIYCGDPNSLIYFQRKFRVNRNSTEDGYWLPRLLLTIIICIICVIFVNKLDLNYFLIGVLLAYFLPQGRVSNSREFQVVIFSGGLIKILISILVMKYSRSSHAVLPLLLCLATASNYLASTYYHAIYIVNDILNRNFANKINFRYEFIECCKSFSITLPIHFYTSLGGFAYINLKGETGLATYFLYDRIIRGLGATVTVFQSKTMGEISKLSLVIEILEIKEFAKYILLYLISGFIIGCLFIFIGRFMLNIIGLDVDIFDNSFLAIIPLSVSSMYISNLIGIQIFMVNNNYKIMFIASIVAILTFYLTLLTSNNILLMISIPEISITVFLIYCLYIKTR